MVELGQRDGLAAEALGPAPAGAGQSFTATGDRSATAARQTEPMPPDSARRSISKRSAMTCATAGLCQQNLPRRYRRAGDGVAR
jgi:hypothetical protein